MSVVDFSDGTLGLSSISATLFWSDVSIHLTFFIFSNPRRSALAIAFLSEKKLVVYVLLLGYSFVIVKLGIFWP